jgi:16S rRNA G527 N7-methylase RsmG
LLEMIPGIDYDRIWFDQIRAFDHGQDTADYWNRRSHAFHCTCHGSNYAEELIQRMDLKPGYSILDVGSGCGAVAIPLAKRGNGVTALDISQIRLDKLEQKARDLGLTNIRTVNQDWKLISVGWEVGAHDIVLLSRNICIDLLETLKKVNQAARTAFYITWRAERYDPFETDLAVALGKDRSVFPDFKIIREVLSDMGISTDTEIFEEVTQAKYHSPREAALEFARGTPVSESQLNHLAAVAANYLTQDGKHFLLTRKIKWALICGNK